jgi:hypothetical protein
MVRIAVKRAAEKTTNEPKMRRMRTRTRMQRKRKMKWLVA